MVTHDLFTTELPFVDLPWIAGAYSLAEQHTPEVKEALAVSDKLIAKLHAADEIVIGAPMYSFTIPAILKAWIDHIVRIGITFCSSYEGLLKNEKATVIVSSGSAYSPGSQMGRAQSRNRLPETDLWLHRHQRSQLRAGWWHGRGRPGRGEARRPDRTIYTYRPRSRREVAGFRIACSNGSAKSAVPPSILHKWIRHPMPT